MQPTKIKSKPHKFMFVMFDMYVKLPPNASSIAVNKFYLLTYLLTYINWLGIEPRLRMLKDGEQEKLE